MKNYNNFNQLLLNNKIVYNAIHNFQKEDAVKNLIDNYSDVTDKNNDRNILMYAVGYGDYYTVEKIIESGKIDLYHKDKYGKNALFFCTNEKILKLLLDKKLDYLSKTNEHKTLLQEYIGYYQIQYLLDLPDIEKIINDDKYGMTPLHLACQKDEIEDVELLLKYGAKIDVGQYSILDFTTEPKIIKLLIDNGADVNKVNSFGYTPLASLINRNTFGHGFLEVNFIKKIKYILIAGADPNYKREKESIVENLLSSLTENRITILKIFFKYSTIDLKFDIDFISEKILYSSRISMILSLFLDYDMETLKKLYFKNTTLLHFLSSRNEIDILKKILKTNEFNWFEKNEKGEYFLDLFYKSCEFIVDFVQTDYPDKWKEYLKKKQIKKFKL